MPNKDFIKFHLRNSYSSRGNLSTFSRGKIIKFGVGTEEPLFKVKRDVKELVTNYKRSTLGGVEINQAERLGALDSLRTRVPTTFGSALRCNKAKNN